MNLELEKSEYVIYNVQPTVLAYIGTIVLTFLPFSYAHTKHVDLNMSNPNALYLCVLIAIATFIPTARLIAGKRIITNKRIIYKGLFEASIAFEDIIKLKTYTRNTRSQRDIGVISIFYKVSIFGLFNITLREFFDEIFVQDFHELRRRLYYAFELYQEATGESLPVWPSD